MNEVVTTDNSRVRNSVHHALKLALAFSTALAAFSVPSFAAEDATADSKSATSALMEEITVTARKREESIEKTPISMSAYSGAAIEARGITNISDISRFTPNLVIQNNPSYGGSNSSAAVFIRGVGQKDFIATVEPGVGMYIDGVYMARSIGGLLDLVDVQRIEVLRGPQGTLFGRNTIGGAISITTEKPGPELGGKASATYGTDNRIEIKGSVNVPIANGLYMKVSGARFKQDGYVSQPATGQKLGDKDSWTGRAALRWVPTEKIEFNLAVDGTRTRENGAPLVVRGVNYNSAIFNPNNLPLLPPGSPATPGFYVINPPADVPTDNFSLLNNYVMTLLADAGNCLGLGSATYNPQGDQTNPACYGSQYFGESSKTSYGTVRSVSDSDIWGVNFTADWTVNDELKLKSITAYRKLKSTFQRDEDESPLGISALYDTMDEHQFSQELQLQGNSIGNKLKWILGAYYFDEHAVNPNIVDFFPVKILSGGSISNKSYAAFAQGTYSLTDQLNLTAGLRYTKDKKSFLPDQYVIDGKFTGLPAGFRVLPYTPVDTSVGKWTPMVNLAYQLTPDLMGYLTYSQGYKSGGFTQRVFPPLSATPTFNPETVKVYEGGLKWVGFDRKLHLNAAAYYTDYKDIQVQVFTGVAPVFRNAAKARIQGFEFDFQAAPGDGWFFEGSAGYTDPKFKEIGAGATELTVDSQFEKVSKWMLSAAISKEIPLSNYGSLMPRIDWSYRSHYFNDARNNPVIAQPGYHLFNANLTWNSPDEKWSLAGGVNNIFKNNYIIVGIWNPTVGDEMVMPNRGREWYTTLKAKF
jgi:iron complex outermembrane receptor protein